MSEKFVVCPRCDGEGYVSKLGAFTSSDLDEWYGQDADERSGFVAEYTTRGGAYDEQCPVCRGQRVVTKAEVEAMHAQAEDEYVYESYSC